ncbi:MAG: radical SAM protein [Candidatus Hydrothermarchaeota archaeon]|nr:radical SAM protein [Candidatus Hydrothermarchaeota archaeon]
MEGAKLVLFISGVCNRTCYYCPLSEKRKGVDNSWANERPVSSIEDIFLEAEQMKALGAGITGGDPDLRMDKTLRYIRALKEAYDDFHIHMYTSNALDANTLRKLRESGLDEMRYHILSPAAWKSLRLSKKLGIPSGIEIPAVPEEEETLLGIIDKAMAAKADFVNLNELEFSDTNSTELLKRGFEVKDDGFAASGSYETALAVLEKRNMNIHFCTSRYKDAVQLKRRLLRIAKNTAKEYEEITEDGLLLKGVVMPTGQLGLRILRKKIIKRYSVPPELIQVDAAKNRLETTREIASFLSDELHGKTKCYSIEEYPTYDRLETEVIPL